MYHIRSFFSSSSFFFISEAGSGTVTQAGLELGILLNGWYYSSATEPVWSVVF